MSRASIPLAVIAAVMLLAAPARAATCVGVWYPGTASYEYPTSMTYDTTIGVSLSMTKVVSGPSGPITTNYTIVLSKLLKGEPNPDFDRMYGLLLKGMPERQLFRICFDGTIGSGTPPELTSVSIRDVNAQKVMICDENVNGYCATVTSSGQLSTTP